MGQTGETGSTTKRQGFAIINELRKTVESIVVSEGPAVQGIYQQVIREYPELIGGVSSLWESKRRYECLTNSL